jgi:hypothetical protein
MLSGIVLWLLVYANAMASTNQFVHTRGEELNGHAAEMDLHLPWAPGGPAELWRRKIGEGYSGAIIVGDRIYTQTQSLHGQHVVCLDLKSGRTIWKTRYNFPWDTSGQWPGPYATPTYLDGNIYFAGCFGTVGRLDAQSGARIWTRDLGKAAKARMPGFGYACTPLVFENRVIIPAGGEDCAVIALHIEDGSPAWCAGSARVTFSSPIAVDVDGEQQIIVFLENVAMGIRSDNGEELWNYDISNGYDPHCAWPLYYSPYLFYGLPFLKGGYAFRLGTGRTSPIEQVWHSDVLSIDLLSATIVDGFIYGFDVRDPQTSPTGDTRGTFKCVELATGTEQWSSMSPGHASVTACGDSLILLNETGTLIITESNPGGYHEFSRHTLFPGKVCWTPPAISEGYLVARCRTELVCLFLGDPNSEKAPIPASPMERIDEKLTLTSVFERYHDKSFWSPTFRQFLVWFIACLIGIFIPAALIGGLAGGPPHFHLTSFILTSVSLGIAGTWLATLLIDQFVFTWPTIPFIALLAIVHCYRWSKGDSGIYRAIFSRLALVLFAISILVYAGACKHFYIVCGWGYLVGMVPALPLLLMATRSSQLKTHFSRPLAAIILGFAVYFWSGALFLSWRSGVSFE